MVTTPVADHRLPSGLNINLCHSRATADSQAHSRVFCGEFGTKWGKYCKPVGFYHCKPAGLWWPICSRIQIDLTEFHQGKVIQEISLFLHLCVAVLSGPVDWHWLWGIGGIHTLIPSPPSHMSPIKTHITPTARPHWWYNGFRWGFVKILMYSQVEDCNK